MSAARQTDLNHKLLSLNLKIASDVPHEIWTDKEQLSRLLGILIGNAIKFTDNGGVTLDVSRQDSLKDGAYLLFNVIDSGIGIPEGMLERIFDPFVQGDGSYTRRHGGVGLGLSIAMQIAQLLNGRLWAEHLPVGGSSLKFSLKILEP
jgi:signal transduction histidine kinase